MGGSPLRIAVMISGRGTNMAAIARACGRGQIRATVVAVIADREEASGIPLARDLALETEIVPHRSHAERASFENALGATLERHRPDLIALAGFMRILSPGFVRAWSGRMLNVHPALLPRHRGLETHRRVLEARESEHGASVHYVTPEVDGGPVILQSRLRVSSNDTEETLSARVQASEHTIYPRAIGWIAEGRLVWREGTPVLDGRELAVAIVEDFG
jgi:phosphoribosylglycinamide formyltransferase 1